MKEYNWAKEIFEGKNSNLNAVNNENGSSIEIYDAKEGIIENFKIYGNSVQNETSTTESVGDMTKNLYSGQGEHTITGVENFNHKSFYII